MKLPRLSRLLLVSALVLLLSACASTAGSGTNTAAGEGQLQNGAGPQLSQPMQLAIGILKLEGSEQAIQAGQAAGLLPLWQAYQSLSESSTAAQVEVDAVLDQIEESLTSEQLQVIEDMHLTALSLPELFQELGIQGDFVFSQGTPDPNMLSTVEAGGGSFLESRGGGPPPGEGGLPPEGGIVIERQGAQAGIGPGGGMGPMTAGSTPDPEMMATRQAMAGGFTGGDRLNPALFQALIDLLQSKTTPVTEP